MYKPYYILFIMPIILFSVRVAEPVARRRLVISALAWMALFLTSAAGAEIMSVSTEKANVRESPGLGSPVLWQAHRFTPFEVRERKGEWAYVSDFVGDTGWLHSSVLTETSAVIVTGKYANIRTGPGLNYEVIATAEYECPLKAIERHGDWLKVLDVGGIEGWIFVKLVWGSVDPGM